MGNIIVNGNIRLKEVENCEKGGVTPMQSAVKYGLMQPTLGEMYPFFMNKNIYDRHKSILNSTRPVITRTHVAFFKIPLGDAIEKDGKERFLVGRKGKVEWLFPIYKDFLKDRGISLSQRGLFFVVENNYKVEKIGESAYKTNLAHTLIKDINTGVLPNKGWSGWNNTSKLPLLFGQGAEALPVYLSIPDEEVGVGMSAAGYTFHPHNPPLLVSISCGLDRVSGAFVH